MIVSIGINNCIGGSEDAAIQIIRTKKKNKASLIEIKPPEESQSGERM